MVCDADASDGSRYRVSITVTGSRTNINTRLTQVSKIPASTSSIGVSKSNGYAKGAPTVPTSTTTTTTTLPPTSGNAAFDGPPPGDGSPWQPAPKPLVIDIVKQQAACAACGGYVYPSTASYWISQDPNAPQWHFVFVFVPCRQGLIVIRVAPE